MTRTRYRPEPADVLHQIHIWTRLTFFSYCFQLLTFYFLWRSVSFIKCMSCTSTVFAQLNGCHGFLQHDGKIKKVHLNSTAALMGVVPLYWRPGWSAGVSPSMTHSEFRTFLIHRLSLCFFSFSREIIGKLKYFDFERLPYLCARCFLNIKV